MRRIKFFSRNDLSSNWYLNNIDDRIYSLINKSDLSINDYLEIYNCSLYYKEFENYVFKDETSEFLKKTKGIIGKYFSKVNNESFYEVFKEIEKSYTSDFLFLFENYNIYDKIEDYNIFNIIKEGLVSLRTICKFKDIVNKYNDVILKLLESNFNNVEIILDIKLRRSKGTLPQHLTTRKINSLIQQYIFSKNPNFNYLIMIAETTNYNGFSVSTKNRSKAKSKIDKIKNSYFSNDNQGTLKHKIIIKYGEVYELRKMVFEDDIFTLIFDYNYLVYNLDYPTILNNFIWIFEYMDINGNLTSTLNNRNKQTTIENLLSFSVPNSYPISYAFQFLESIQNLSMNLYYRLLKQNHIDIEMVIKWFFEEYLLEEFVAKGFKYNTSTASTYREKCLNLVANIENLLEQYRCYNLYGQVDLKLISNNSNGILIDTIKSSLSEKNIYPEATLKECCDFLFSNQSNIYLDILEEIDYEKTVYELLIERKEKGISFIREPYLLDLLIKTNILRKLDKEKYVIGNIKLVSLIKKLNDYNCLSLLRLNKNDKEAVEILRNQELLVFTNELFSELEIDMFNYYLNNKRYSNGPSLRNNYAHGKLNYLNEEEHYNNYIILLRVIIMIILKINEDFCLKEL
ncbi:hypothetical protein [Staphylococcus debuckii]|uniref:DUF4209 domain-containing protein n=1 Tax=Staphylococcus debuckii TaxID=2044912 RepID=A0ABU9EUQ2_9STAP